jgi:hypothetical protein
MNSCLFTTSTTNIDNLSGKDRCAAGPLFSGTAEDMIYEQGQEENITKSEG